MKTFRLIIICIMAATVSCTVEDQKHYYVAPELRPFVNNFYKKALDRGIDLQRNYLTVVLGSLAYSHDEQGSNGMTSPGAGVTLDVNFVTQKLSTGISSDSIQVEYVVFHELGHFLLHRDHLSPKHYTIMTAQSSYLGDYRSYPDKRKKLIEELFNSSY